ncbi:sodium:proton antiporter NhaD [Microbacter margulisiae]|uniref:Na+/H+ antiporter NhaD/arsenite permease-like protein n=1 Tax=Microbacter margulisiae TaxID=1350067 RepID=A0A7W5DTE9_9PORP|nr:sodium:proton antiporter NhaD [Microbacter margulisiae]MBB3188756.1 Na+/H+ antiporter NhaD/arsenite permease-like protein [Microbacter margulisiae]
MTIMLLSIFGLGYAIIAFENTIKINKTATALIAGVLCWTAYILFSPDKLQVNNDLISHLGNISSILFFLLGAMTIVELIDAHNGFEIITEFISQTNKRRLIWIVGFLTFFLSSILDNLTTTIVMVSLLRKLIKTREDRLLFVGIVVIAANAGGAWTPIGDVTTTMLWIGGQISTFHIMQKLFLPSLVCLIIPLLFLSLQLKGKVERVAAKASAASSILTKNKQKIILSLGLLILILVPVFKTYTELPPFMGMLLGLGILWVVTEIMYKGADHEEKKHLTLVNALHKIDIPSILFFLGILMLIAALETSGILSSMALWLSNAIGNLSVIVMSIGLSSAVIDNVPLVAATQGMYHLVQYPADSFIWEFLAFCAGTGGSILIIGSAAGVAAMGMEKIDFFWYVKKISWLALLGYLGGSLTYIFIEKLFY